MDTLNKKISGGSELFYQNIIYKNKKILLDHSKYFSNIFLTIATSEYLNFSLNLASSIEYAAPNWGMLIFTYGVEKSLLNKIKLPNFVIMINSDFPFDCNSFEDQKAFSANSRIPILKILTNSYRYNSIFYTDADSIVMRDPKEIINMMDKSKKAIAFRGYTKHLYTLKNGFTPFKSGVIICRPRMSKCLDKLLLFYSSKVLSKWNLWSADQICLSKIVTEFRFKDLIFIGKRKINDWDFLPYTYVWQAKGNLKSSFSWLLTQKITFLFNKKCFKYFKSLSHFLKNLIMLLVSFIFFFERKIPSMFMKFLINQYRYATNKFF